MQGAVSSPLIVAPGVAGGFTGTPAGAGGLALPLLGITKIVHIRTQRLSLCDDVWAGPITRLPDIKTIIPAHVESIFFSAGYFGCAFIIADTPIYEHATTVHLGSTCVANICDYT